MLTTFVDRAIDEPGGDLSNRCSAGGSTRRRASGWHRGTNCTERVFAEVDVARAAWAACPPLRAAGHRAGLDSSRR